MRIEQLRVDRFGHFERADFGPLADGLTVIHGPNEAGKSTLHAFVRAMLFGFPRRGSAGWVPGRAGGGHGGRLALLDEQGEPCVVERHSNTRRGAAQVTLASGELGGEEALGELLAGVSSDIYQSIFAFGLDELQALNALPAEAISGRIYAAGFGAEQLPDATAHFQRQAAGIFLPRGRVQPVARLLGELEAIERELAASRGLVEGYHHLGEQRDRAADEARRLAGQLAGIEDARQRIDILERNRAAAAERLVQARAELDEAERGLRDLAPGDEDAIPPADPARLRVRLDEVREAWTRLRAAHSMTQVYQETARRQRSPRGPWLLMFLIAGTLTPLVIGALTGQSIVLAIGMLSALLGTLALVLAVVARSRYEAAQGQARLHMQITHRDAERRFLHAAAQAGIDPARPDWEIERLEAELHAHQLASESRAELDELHELVELRQRRLESAALDLDQETRATAQAMAEWHAFALDLGYEPETMATPDQARADVEEQRSELLIERGRLDERLRQIEADTQAAELRLRRESLLTDLRRQTREWAVNIVAGALLREARQVYEQERQPAVLRSAGEAFDAMTLGAYHRLIMAEGDAGTGIVALSREGKRVEAGRMSRGTREQAYLALRIGLIREFGERVRPLPVLIDDVLVNFDPGRAAEAMRLFVRLGQTHQVLLFTCHPSTVAVARFVNPGVRVISLGEHHAGRVDPLRITND